MDRRQRPLGLLGATEELVGDLIARALLARRRVRLGTLGTLGTLEVRTRLGSG